MAGVRNSLIETSDPVEVECRVVCVCVCVYVDVVATQNVHLASSIKIS